MSQAWICDKCGEIVQGDMCLKCGNPIACQGPGGPAPGSYYSLIGYRSLEAFKFLGCFVLALFLVQFVGGLVLLGPRRFSLSGALWIAGLVTILVFRKRIASLYWKVRDGRHRMKGM